MRGGGVKEVRGGGVMEVRGGGVTEVRGGGVMEVRGGGVMEVRGGGVAEVRGGGGMVTDGNSVDGVCISIKVAVIAGPTPIARGKDKDVAVTIATLLNGHLNGFLEGGRQGKTGGAVRVCGCDGVRV